MGALNLFKYNLKIKNMLWVIKMAKKKNKRVKRNLNLAVAPPKCISEGKKGALLNAGEASVNDLNIRRSSRSYVQKAHEHGVYEEIAIDIQMFREANPDSTYEQVYAMLHEKHAEVFEKETYYSGNISKVLNSDPMWSNAYWTNRDRLISRASIGLKCKIDDTDLGAMDYTNILAKLERIKLEQAKLELERQRLELEKQKADLENGNSDTEVIIEGFNGVDSEGDDVCELD